MRGSHRASASHASWVLNGLIGSPSGPSAAAPRLEGRRRRLAPTATARADPVERSDGLRDASSRGPSSHARALASSFDRSNSRSSVEAAASLADGDRSACQTDVVLNTPHRNDGISATAARRPPIPLLTLSGKSVGRPRTPSAGCRHATTLHRSAPAPSRKTERSRSRRSSSSAVGAGEPHLALLHEVRAVGERERDVHRLLDEHDRDARSRSSAAPRRAAPGRRAGASPSDSSSISSSFGRSTNDCASVSIWRSPPDSEPARWPHALAEPREQLEHLVHPLGDERRLSRRIRKQPILRFSSTVRPGKTPRPGHLDDAARRRALRRLARDRLAVEPHVAAVRLDDARDGVERRRLARAVGAEQRDDLALAAPRGRRRTAPARRRSDTVSPFVSSSTGPPRAGRARPLDVRRDRAVRRRRRGTSAALKK